MNDFHFVPQGNWYTSSAGYDFRQYKPVTAYTVDQPVYVNQQNINVFPYQALNYQPEGAQFPYVYVPIAQFSKVGAQVNWDEETLTLSVTSDYYQIRNELTDCQKKLKDCMTSLKTQMAEHPPANPMNKVGQQELHDMITPYIIRPEMGYNVWSAAEEDEKTFGVIHVEHMQPGSIYHPPGAAFHFNQELLDKLTEAYGYPVRFNFGNRHWSQLGVYKY
ncbi:hypothetical protein [Niallia endozanthoxylica]|uniref:Uncharacterized protein n=1 Tax=Niallia endozanthoxylica TaxID=2036016 RepID=A0A5J5I0G4_9BACI|nr:hypothetical protein [Niallia endozanthoxylica]KAA9026979.1 hypothetical protein F4V44_06570 [Niallia endozanthoxylica]